MWRAWGYDNWLHEDEHANLYRYTIRDRKSGKVFDTGWIKAVSRTEAREILLHCARRDTPGGRGRSPRLYGYVPVSDYRISFEKEERR